LVVETGKNCNFANELHFTICERRQGQIAHRFRCGRFLEDAFAIAELFESFESSIASIATVTNPTKALIVAENLEHAIV
jgi:hypothetical protein